MNRVGARLRRDFASVLNNLQLNTDDVILHADVSVPGVDYDKNVASTYPAPVPVARTFRALVHFISDATRLYGMQGFEAGDVLLFLRPEENTAGADAWFEIQGSAYVQKECGTLLAQDWSLQVGGTLIHRAMLLTRRKGEPVRGPEFGTVLYAEGAERRLLYRYGDTAGFTGAATLDTAKGEIADGAGGLEFFVLGTLAMRAAAGTLLVNGLSNGTVDGPRLEFFIGGRLAAALSRDGVLAVPAAVQAAAQPVSDRDFDLRTSGAWVASLGLAGVTAGDFDQPL